MRFGAFGIPVTEWSLVQPYIDRLNAVYTRASEAGLPVEESGEEWGRRTRETIARIQARADAANHLRDDPSLLTDAETWARQAEAQLEQALIRAGGSPPPPARGSMVPVVIGVGVLVAGVWWWRRR